MPHAALWVVQLLSVPNMYVVLGFQCRTRLCGWCSFVGTLPLYGTIGVSMPHAALWVVQLDTVWAEAYERGRFNAARGFVGGAALRH